MNMERLITVYCGSSSSLAPVFTEAAAALGREIALAGATLVTGAGRTGLMGAVADAAMAAGGRAVGIIPQFMVDRGWQHDGMSELIITPDMHERKQRMARSGACIALPGGIGTFEELCEILTWRQLGLYGGNVVIYNVADYYAPFLAMFDRAVSQGFMRPDHRALFKVAATASEAVAMALEEPVAECFSPKF